MHTVTVVLVEYRLFAWCIVGIVRRVYYLVSPCVSLKLDSCLGVWHPWWIKLPFALLSEDSFGGRYCSMIIITILLRKVVYFHRIFTDVYSQGPVGNYSSSVQVIGMWWPSSIVVYIIGPQVPKNCLLWDWDYSGQWSLALRKVYRLQKCVYVCDNSRNFDIYCQKKTVTWVGCWTLFLGFN